ncbi:Putative signal peptidase complex subunit 1 [Verticillium dahliae VDG1]|nr:Putative signal peptidase complex subunit 1 [Verticillium dahliae VDG1]
MASRNTDAGWDDSTSSEGTGTTYQFPEISVPLWATLLGVTESQIQTSTKRVAGSIAQKLSRPITQEEVASLTTISARDVVIHSLKLPIGVTMAAVIAYNGRAKFRFPFWQPKWVKTSAHVFPSLHQQVLKGQAAHYAWHTSRAGEAPGGQTPDWGRYASRASKTELIRAKDELEAACAKAEESLRNSANTSQEDLESGLNAIREAKTEQLRRLDEAIAAKEDPQQSVDQEKEYDTLAGSGPGAPATLQSTYSTGSTKPATWGSGSTETTQSPSWVNSGVEGIDDDASPVAPGARGSPQGTFSGSAWDRVRQQAAADRQQQGRVPNANAGSYGSNYPYKATEKDKAEAKSQAQEEFDALLERERQVDEGKSGWGRRS